MDIKINMNMDLDAPLNISLVLLQDVLCMTLFKEMMVILMNVKQLQMADNTKHHLKHEKEMTEQDLKVNASIRFLCDRYMLVLLVKFNTSEPQNFSDNIKINHIVKRFQDNTCLLNFNVDEDSFPIEMVIF